MRSVGAQTESKWLPIESAPKDGTWILAYCDFADGGKEPRIVRWVADDRPTDDRPFGPFIWATQDGRPNIGTIAERVATHWQPLPPPPNGDVRG
jgi:hypothetical protein